MSGPTATTSGSGLSSEADSPSTPSHRYTFPVSRRSSGSTTASELHLSSSHGFYRLPYYGNCHKCHHHYDGEVIKLPIDRNKFTGIRCSKCHSKMFGFGGNSTHLSLVSVDSIDPRSPHIQVERDFRAALVHTTRSVGAIGSPSLREVPEYPLPREASRDPSVHNTVDHDSQDIQQAPPIGNHSQFTTTPWPRNNSPTNTGTESTMLNRVPSQATHPCSAVKSFRPLFGWFKEKRENLKHNPTVKRSLSKNAKAWRKLIKQHLKVKPKAPLMAHNGKEPMLGIPPSPHEESISAHDINAVRKLPAKYTSLSPGTIYHKYNNGNSNEPPNTSTEERVRSLRRKFTEQKCSACGPNYPCISHKGQASNSVKAAVSITHDQIPYPFTLDDRSSPFPYNYLTQTVNNSHPDLLHLGRRFDDSSSLSSSFRVRPLSVSTIRTNHTNQTTFSNAPTAFSNDSVPAFTTHQDSILTFLSTPRDVIPAYSGHRFSHGLNVAGPRSQSPRAPWMGRWVVDGPFSERATPTPDPNNIREEGGRPVEHGAGRHRESAFKTLTGQDGEQGSFDFGEAVHDGDDTAERNSSGDLTQLINRHPTEENDGSDAGTARSRDMVDG
ncbi:hypothetical protein GQ43DRAFT_484759 [Delitschia confertaspora ATCC 74209]|uniref:Uncharacterized protein n=1 Tax=Delitschia confertaspora ATCC 74209 TaxID=1513339 RepID=A0A9P4JC93_9PLEO|nr:hypothetical protein GQ43DRAFT_484759 [Delitschia confertaspora ATCC 74209]